MPGGGIGGLNVSGGGSGIGISGGGGTGANGNCALTG